MKSKVVMARAVRGSCLLVALVTAAGGAELGRRLEAQGPLPLKVDVELVTVPTTVTDRQGRAIAGLTKQDFSVSEDRVEQDVALFENQPIPVSIGIVFDTSGSMVDKIDDVGDAVLHFIETSNPGDEIFLMAFSDRVDLVQGFTDDRSRLRRAIRGLDARGGTALYDAVIGGLLQLQRGRHQKKALLLVTDGNDTASRASLSDAIDAARRSEAIIYALGIGHGEGGVFGHQPDTFKDIVDAKVLQRIADRTGGRSFVLEAGHEKGGVDRIDQACLEVSNELRTQYVLGYYPKNPRTRSSGKST